MSKGFEGIQAQYVLRIDDLCPTLDRERWRLVAAMVRQYDLKPILAVVPDNRDPALRFCDASPEFWGEMRSLQECGATIALHGLHHTCVVHGRSLVPLHTVSEFAGVPIEQQRADICTGLKILRGHGLRPRLLIAPRHGFDRNTLRALKEEGLDCVCDGFAKRPLLREGVVWLPQQLWGPVEKKRGLWTICVHPNTLTEDGLRNLDEFVLGHWAQFTCFERALRDFPPTPRRIGERLAEFAAVGRILARRWLGDLRHRALGAQG